MRKLTTLFFILFLSVFSFSEAEKCLQPKDVTVKKVEEVLSPVLGGAKVVAVSKSPIKDMYEVVIEARGKKIPVYIDCTLNYLVTGEIIDIKEKRSLTRERARQLALEESKEKIEKLKKVIGEKKLQKLKEALGERFADIKIIDLEKVPKKYLFSYGNPAAKLTVYVVTDPECPFCAKFDTEMQKVLKERNDVKFEIILFPLPFHKHAQKITQRIVCEKSLSKKREILEKSFEVIRNRDEKKLEELGKECEEGKKAIQEHLKFGSDAGIGGTPTLIFPYGIVVSGWMTADQINRVLDALK